MPEYISAISKCMVDTMCVTRAFYPANSLIHPEKNVNKTNNNGIIYGGDGGLTSGSQTGGRFNDLGVPVLLVLVTKEEGDLDLEHLTEPGPGPEDEEDEDDHYLSDQMFDQMVQRIQMIPEVKPTSASSHRAKLLVKEKGRRTRKNKERKVAAA